MTQPEYFEGVLGRRLLAFAIDAVIILAPIVLLALFIFVFGIVTLSLGWMLFPVLGPAFVIWAIWYNAMTLGSPASATLGMRAMDIEMRTWYGAPPTPCWARSMRWPIGCRSASARPSFCSWLCSTGGGGSCTTSWWAQWWSTVRPAPRICVATVFDPLRMRKTFDPLVLASDAVALILERSPEVPRP